jgi:hypothetical protein
VLKTKGYHLEHNFGHGKKNLSALLMTFNLLAFLFHTVSKKGTGKKISFVFLRVTSWLKNKKTLSPLWLKRIYPAPIY